MGVVRRQMLEYNYHLQNISLKDKEQRVIRRINFNFTIHNVGNGKIIDLYFTHANRWDGSHRKRSYRD